MTKIDNKNRDSLLFNSENELRKVLIRILQAKGIRPFVEIPFLGRSIDIAYRCSDGSITAIEIKRYPKHIQRALNQAKICLLGADKVYVCTLDYNMSDKTKSVFKNLSVGLIFLKQNSENFSIHYVIPAGQNGRKRKEYVSLLGKAIAQREGDI